MVAIVVVHARFGEDAFWVYKAFDGVLGMLTPGDIEGAEFWEKDHLAIGQVIVNPPG